MSSIYIFLCINKDTCYLLVFFQKVQYTSSFIWHCGLCCSCLVVINDSTCYLHVFFQSSMIYIYTHIIYIYLYSIAGIVYCLQVQHELCTIMLDCNKVLVDSYKLYTGRHFVSLYSYSHA